MSNIAVSLADTIMRRYPDLRDFTDAPWSYAHGYLLAGFEKLSEASGDGSYFNYLKRFVDSHVTGEGDVPAFKGDSLDDVLVGVAILAVYQRTGESKYRQAATRLRQAFDGYPTNHDGGYWHSKTLSHQMWIDGVFMGQLFLTRYGTTVGDKEFCQETALTQLLLMADRLAKGSTGLLLHAYDESHQASWSDKGTGLSSEVWSEGLGWYCLMLAELLDVLEDKNPRRKALVSVFIRLAEALKFHQDPSTGLWYQVVDKAGEPENWHDTSGSAMFVYFLRRGMDLGLLNFDQYSPVAAAGFAGIKTKVSVSLQQYLNVTDACEGVCVQDSYQDYVRYPRKLNAREAVGGVLWAAVAMEY